MSLSLTMTAKQMVWNVLLLLIIVHICEGKVARPLSVLDQNLGVTIPKNITAIVIAAIGRTGSTMLAEMFNTIPGVFMIVEPYNRFIPRFGQSKVATAVMPTLESLLDCSFALNHHTVNNIMWKFTCLHSRLVDGKRENSFRERCLDGAVFGYEDARAIRAYCLASPIRVVKTIRLVHMTPITRNSLTTLSQREGFNVKLIHAIRHPFKTLASQYGHGWHKVLEFRTCDRRISTCNQSSEPLSFNTTQIQLASDHLVMLGDDVCKEMDRTTQAIREIELPARSTAVLRYEDFVPPYTVRAIRTIALFLGQQLVPNKAIANRLEQISTRKHAGFVVTGHEFRDAQAAGVKNLGEAQPRMAASKACWKIYQAYSYGP